MTTRIDAVNLIGQMLVSFPELEGTYQSQLGEYKGQRLSNYEVVAHVFRPALKDELSKGELNEFLRRAARFIEDVCESGDSEAINVIWVKIFEWLIFKPKELHLFWPALGEVTRYNIKDAARRWAAAGQHLGNTKNLPTENLPEQ